MKTINAIVDNSFLLTDGGLETTFIFENGMDLPHFAAFPMVEDAQKKKILKNYYIPYLEVARKNNTGFILESATYKAHPDVGSQLGYSQEELNNINQLAIKQLKEIKTEYSCQVDPILISGCMGPRKDGYSMEERMTVKEAKRYHIHQIKAFKAAGADMATAFTLNYVEEAIGIVLAAKETDIPVVISFTLETDGKLIDGTSVSDAILQVDLTTRNYTEYFMINCAHPSHFQHEIAGDKICAERIKAIRANASNKSHAELDESTELDAGDKHALAVSYKKLKTILPNLSIYGGCCGTNSEHVEVICEAIK